MDKNEALKLGLQVVEAAEYLANNPAIENLASMYRKKEHWALIQRSKIAFEEALAQPEQEPVAWELRAGKTDRVLIEITNNPQRAHDWKAGLAEVVPLYAAPPQREWVGLTEEEKESFWKADQMTHEEWDELFAATEATLREKNGG